MIRHRHPARGEDKINVEVDTMLIKFIFVCVLFIESRAATCPDGFESRNGDCYFFSHGKETWIGAYETCKLFGAMLVEVNDRDENTYLVGKMAGTGDRWWISLTDKEVEGQYVWESSMSIIGSEDFTFWGDGEPNNSGGENCVYYRGDHPQWTDTECTNEAKYICEINTGIEVVG